MGLLLLGLAGAGVAGLAMLGGGGGSRPDDVDNPPRGRTWSDPTTTSLVVDARGWYMDVRASPGESPNEACEWTKCGAFCFLCNEVDGEATPLPRPFQLRFRKLDAPAVVAVDVRIVDVDGVALRTKVRTRKQTDGRKRGFLDVNEYTLEGGATETVYCERLARRIDSAVAGPYLTRRKLPCDDLPSTPSQTYSLYRAQRETTPGPKANPQTMREWFAKVRQGSPPYALRQSLGAGGSYRGLYALKLGVDAGGVYIFGEVAPSVAPQRLRIDATWRTRAP